MDFSCIHALDSQAPVFKLHLKLIYNLLTFLNSLNYNFTGEGKQGQWDQIKYHFLGGKRKNPPAWSTEKIPGTLWSSCPSALPRVLHPRHQRLWRCVCSARPSPHRSDVPQQLRLGTGTAQPHGTPPLPHNSLHGTNIPTRNGTSFVFQPTVLSGLTRTYVPFTEENHSLCEKTHSRLECDTVVTTPQQR